MILEVKGLYSGYGKMTVLHDINLAVELGNFLTVIGPNGAGKTTLLRSIFNLSLVTIHKGDVVYNGESLVKTDPAEIVQKKITYMPAGANVFPTLTVRENLEMAARKSGKGFEQKLATVYEKFPRLQERKKQKAGTLSGGEKQMLAMGCALIPEPELILFDEPSGGLQPNLVEVLFDSIREIHKEGRTILLVEQAAMEALDLADHGCVIEGGEIVLSGSASDLLQDERTVDRYLGIRKKSEE